MYYVAKRYVQGSPQKRLIIDALWLLGIGLIVWTVWRGDTAANKAFRRADLAACVRIEDLKKVARSQLNHALKTLPTLNYYKLNPGELAKAQDQIHQQLREFRPVHCE